MLDNKAEFIMEYNENLGKNLKRDDIDWSQSKVIFVSTDFTDNQISATNFRDLAIELWEVKQYDNDIIVINPIKKSNSAESIKPIMENKKEFKKISNEIKIYSELDHLKNKSDKIVELYEKFRDGIMSLSDGIKISPQKYYIGFKKRSNICDIEIQNKKLKVFINSKWNTLNDGKNIARNVSNIGHYGNGDYEIVIDTDENFEYIMSLIKEVIFQKFVK